jgi:1-deoxy-D-xylulose-5-phosphate reductoisomerase
LEPVDDVAYPAVRLAREAVAASATHPAVYNAANEEAVAAFLAGRGGFGRIVDTVARVLDEHVGATELTLDAVLEAEAWARGRAGQVLAAT